VIAHCALKRAQVGAQEGRHDAGEHHLTPADRRDVQLLRAGRWTIVAEVLALCISCNKLKYSHGHVFADRTAT
jgi:hypothetical protein